MKIKHIWYSTNVDPSSTDSIHQILMFGKLEDIRSLKEVVGENAIKSAFLTSPKKIYTPAAFNFIKNFVLELTDTVDEQQYLKHTPRSAQ